MVKKTKWTGGSTKPPINRGEEKKSEPTTGVTRPPSQKPTQKPNNTRD